MEWVVFPSEGVSLKNLRFSMKLNVALCDNVLVFRRRRKVRIYKEGGYREYPIMKVVKDGKDTYYVVYPAEIEIKEV